MTIKFDKGTDHKEVSTIRDLWLPKTRVSKIELMEIKAKAQQARSLSDYVRQACRNAEIVIFESTLDVQLKLELARIGNNLNQLTRQVHIQQYIDPTLAENIKQVLIAIQIKLDET